MAEFKNGSLGLGTNNPDASALLDITSTTQGFLPPRMSTTQKNAIVSAATGLILYDTSFNNLQEYNGTSWSSVGVSSGMFGIANSGTYTFYSTLSSAISAATSGQTVEFFTDYTETGNTIVNLKSGVNIDGHGHTYINNNNSATSAISDNNTNISCKIYNLYIQALGTNNNYAFYIQNSSSKIIFAGVTVYTNNNIAVRNNGFMVGIIGETDTANATAGIDNAGEAYFCEGRNYGTTNGEGFINDGAGYAFQCVGRSASQGHGFVNTTSVAVNCSGYNTNRYGFHNNSGYALNCVGHGTGSRAAFLNQGGIAENCSGYGAASFGIEASAGELHNCAGYSTASSGIQIEASASAYNCVGSSTADSGIVSTQTSKIYNCSAISTVAPAIYCTGQIEMFNCFAYSKWNNAAGHAIDLASSVTAGDVFQCVLQVTNASAKCIGNPGAGATIFYGQNLFNGATTPVDSGITQGEGNFIDTQGNITR